jgi:hypothetical protein
MILHAPTEISDDMSNNNDENMLSLSEIDNALDKCGQEIESLYRSLDLVLDREVRLKLSRQQLQLRMQQEQEQEQDDREHEQAAAQKQREQEEEAYEEEEQQQQQQHKSEDMLAKEARIAELVRQIQEVENATKAVVPTSPTPASAKVAKRVKPAVDIPKGHASSAPTTPTADPSKKKKSIWKSPFRKSKAMAMSLFTDDVSSPLASPRSVVKAKVTAPADPAAPTPSATAAPAAPSATPKVEETSEVCKGQTYAAKQKHQWEKPAWALPSEAIEQDADILTAPIQNGMLKHNDGNGYSRRVFAKDIHKVNGQFIAPTGPAAPPPRLAWIIVTLSNSNSMYLDGDKVGKIVMNLEGDDVDRLVGQFLDLKGSTMVRTKEGNLAVEGVDPQLVLTTKKVTKKGRGKTNNVIGEVQEGQDVFETVMKAGADSIVTIKQAHIYPVKKAKGMFA